MTRGRKFFTIPVSWTSNETKKKRRKKFAKNLSILYNDWLISMVIFSKRYLITYKETINNYESVKDKKKGVANIIIN